MPKTAVETAVCDICGAEVRPGSQFCYNCGGSVVKADPVAGVPAPVDPIPDRSPKLGNGAAAVVENVPPPKRDAAERRRVRAANRQPAEIVWEPQNGVSWTFVIASVIFVIIALAVVVVTFYLR